MSDVKPHPDKQYARYCQPCGKITMQVVMDKDAMYCTICCSVANPPPPETSETLKAMMKVMHKAQELDREMMHANTKR